MRHALGVHCSFAQQRKGSSSPSIPLPSVISNVMSPSFPSSVAAARVPELASSPQPQDGSVLLRRAAPFRPDLDELSALISSDCG